MSTVLETIDGGTLYLEKRGIEDARLSMQLMVANRLDCTRMQLYLDFDKPLTEDQLTPLRDDLKRRGEGIPLQHILGNIEFHKRVFKTDARALIPRPETEELISLILNDIQKSKIKNQESSINILDVGTGSGVIGLTLAAELPNSEVTCSDISEDALSLARENAATLSLKNVTFTQADGIPQGTYHLIISNPPYIAETERAKASKEVQHDPDLALYSGTDGLDLIRTLIPSAFHTLTPGGLIALEIGHDQSASVASLLEKNGFTDIQVHHDLNGIPRFPIAKKPL